MINSYVRFSLTNLIGENEGHKIITVEKNQFFDIDKNEISKKEFEDYIANTDVVFAHFLNQHIARIVNRLEPSKKFIWFSWGADFYNLGKFGDDLLQPKTKKLFRKFGRRSFKDFKNLSRQRLGVIADYLPPNKEVIKAIRKASVIVPVVPSDYDNLVSRYPISAERFNMNYLNGMFMKPVETDINHSRNSILVGNSSSFTNNHVEIIDLLSQANVGESNIIIPLVYGNERYRDYISKYAEDSLGEKVRIITDRLPIEDYMRLYSNCHSVIMNHERQQAMGNILYAFWFKTNLYLNKNANHAKDLVSRGFNILDISDISTNKTLTDIEKNQNKELLVKWYGRDSAQQRFTEFQNFIESTILN
jgi:hypothetical protein